jgi:hypothetical protein
MASRFIGVSTGGGGVRIAVGPDERFGRCYLATNSVTNRIDRQVFETPIIKQNGSTEGNRGGKMRVTSSFTY